MTDLKDKLKKLPSSEKELAELIDKISRGCESALNKLYDLTVAQVYGLALKILTKNHDADEVALDVYKQIWNKAGSYEPERGNPSAWLITLTRSRAIDRLRVDKKRRIREDSLDYRDPESPIKTDEKTDIREKRALINGALEELSAGQRKSIELAYYYGLSQSEIAEVMNEPLGTVKSWMRAGLSKLRANLVTE